MDKYDIEADEIVRVLTAAYYVSPRPMSQCAKPFDLRKSIASLARQAAAVPEGHIRDDKGVERKVLGTLPVTADGCVTCVGGIVWFSGDDHGEDEPVSAIVTEITDDDVCYRNAANRIGILDGGCDVGREWLIGCYSTKAAAEAARGGGSG